MPPSGEQDNIRGVQRLVAYLLCLCDDYTNQSQSRTKCYAHLTRKAPYVLHMTCMYSLPMLELLYQGVLHTPIQSAWTLHRVPLV